MKGTGLAAKAAEAQGKGTVLATKALSWPPRQQKYSGTRKGKGSVLTTRAVEAQCKGGVLAAKAAERARQRRCRTGSGSSDKTDDATKEMMQPLSSLPASHLFSRAKSRAKAVSAPAPGRRTLARRFRVGPGCHLFTRA